MSKHFYFIDPNGNFASEDGTIRYRLEKGKKGMETVRAMRMQREVYFYEYQEGEDKILIETDMTFYQGYLKQKNREQYLLEIEAECKPVLLSLDNDMEIDGEEVVYHEVIASDYDLEAEIFKREELSILKKALSALNKEEQDLINAIYLSDNPVSAREYAKAIGVSHTVINRRMERILRKMREFFKKVFPN